MNPKTDRRSRQGQASRARILDATFEIAAAVGYEATSIAEISARSGLPPSSIYWHFGDKDRLFADVVQHSFDRWWASMPRWEPLAEWEDRAVVVADRIREGIDSIATNPEFWRLGLMLTLEQRSVQPTARRLFTAIRGQVLDALCRFWHTALSPAAVERSPAAPGLLARFTMACADGIFITAQAEGPDDLGELGALLASALESAAGRVSEA